MRIYRDLQTVLNLVGAPGFEPGTPCSQITCKEGECVQLAHSWGRDAHIFVHPAPNVFILRGNVSVIVSVLAVIRGWRLSSRGRGMRPCGSGCPLWRYARSGIRHCYRHAGDNPSASV